MLIEQIFEFEWRGLGPLDRTCTYNWLFLRQNKIL